MLMNPQNVKTDLCAKSIVAISFACQINYLQVIDRKPGGIMNQKIKSTPTHINKG
jgi:hypothetical protein